MEKKTGNNDKPKKNTGNNGKKPVKRNKKSTLKKPKVEISAYKVILLCAAVILVCMILLIVTTTVTGNSSKKAKKKETEAKNVITERYEEKPSVRAAVDDLKPPVDNKKSAEQKNDVKGKKEPENKTENKPENLKKTDSNKKVENQNTGNQKKNESPKTENQKNENKKEEKKIATTASHNNSEVDIKTDVNAVVKADTDKKVVIDVRKSENENVNEKKTAESVFGFPKAVNKAQLVFIFDDGGQNLGHINKFLKLPFPYTVAVLPQLVHSKETAQKVRASGNEVILHQPMQSVNHKINPGPGAITYDMSVEQVHRILQNNIEEIWPIAGLNNHEGSEITTDAEKIEEVLKTASTYGIYFLDSRTNVETVVPEVAKAMGYHYYERNIFLDNEKTRENILSELKKGLGIANKNGVVIMIGHVWSADILPAILEEAYPELVAKGYTFSKVSESKARK